MKYKLKECIKKDVSTHVLTLKKERLIYIYYINNLKTLIKKNAHRTDRSIFNLTPNCSNKIHL